MLQIVSGIFLGYAIYSIWKLLKQSIQQNKTDIDIRILAMHASAFGLYMVSLIVSFLFLSYFYLTGAQNSADSLFKSSFAAFSGL